MRLKRLKLKSAIFVLSFLFGALVHGEINYRIQSPKDRFLKYVSYIKPTIQEAAKLKTVEEQVSYLNRSGIRSHLNYLQNLIDLYDGKKRYSLLKPYFESVKELEDHISHYEDLRGFVQTAQNGKAAKKYQDQFNEEKNNYENFLRSSNWLKTDNSELENFVKDLEKIDWDSLDSDRNYLLTQIAHKMKKQHSEEYDMTDYELGMHEFRRDARRISYISSGVGEFVESSYNLSCPMGSPINPEVSMPKAQTSYICYIPVCLKNHLSQAQSEISGFKYEGANYTLKGEPIPEHIVKGAAQVAKKTKEANVYLYLESYILGCRTAEYKNSKKVLKDEKN